MRASARMHGGSNRQAPACRGTSAARGTRRFRELTRGARLLHVVETLLMQLAKHVAFWKLRRLTFCELNQVLCFRAERSHWCIYPKICATLLGPVMSTQERSASR